jgi:acetylornithine/N-succinyldiaminopimelate aminotransferase
MSVLKIGGNELDDAAFMHSLAQAIVAMPTRPVIVHGGGKATSALSARLGLQPRFVDGLRVTDGPTLEAAVMGLVGTASAQLVSALNKAGVPALGLCGADARLVTARRVSRAAASTAVAAAPAAAAPAAASTAVDAGPGTAIATDLGFVGQPVAVDAARLRALLDAGFVPCLAPICADVEGGLLNVNADDVAAAVAAALGAETLLFVTAVPAVLAGEQPLAVLAAAECEQLIAAGTITGGMVPKVRAAARALGDGVAKVRIVDVAGMQNGGGTLIQAPTSLEGVPAVTTQLADVCRPEAHISQAPDTPQPHSTASPNPSQPGATASPNTPHLMNTYARPSFVLERGDGVYLYDTAGKRYLDCLSGIAVNALGYGHPVIAQAIADASATGLVHSSNLFHTDPQTQLARDLCATSFADRVFFCNSGTEAVEGALKLARKATGRHRVVAFEDAFHGRTMGALSVTHNAKYRAPFAPLLDGVDWVPFGDATAALNAITPDTAAVIIEPVQGEGGIRVAPAPYLQALRDRCDEVGAVLIFDEIQCGLGRTGHMWAHQPSGVTPDIMTLAKPLAGGLPLGCFMATEAVAGAFVPGDHGSTFGGGPLVASVARAVLATIGAAAFLDHVNAIGQRLGDGLRQLQHAAIREVRGCGLMLGVELKDPWRVADVVSAG